MDLIIIRGGAAGFAASNRANQLKKRTLIINNSNILPLEGTCVNVFPTMSEMIKKAAQSFEQNPDEIVCCVE